MIIHNRQGFITYRVPIPYLVLGAADILFWDAIFYLFERDGWGQNNGEQRVELSVHKLVELTGLSRRKVGILRKTLTTQKAPYHFYEEESSEPWHFVLVAKDYSSMMQRHVIFKPVELMSHGWLAYLHVQTGSRIPLAIVNCFLRRPPDRRTLSVRELRERTKHPERVKPPETARLYDALEQLELFGVLRRLDAEKYELIEGAFDNYADADELYKHQAARPKPAILQQAERETPQLAERVNQLITLAKLDADLHVQDMLRDVKHIQSETEYKILERSVKRNCRKTPPGPQRWFKLWQAFCKSRDRRSRRVYTPKERFHFRNARTHQQLLSLPLDSCVTLRYAKLVMWLNDPDYILHHHHGIRIRLLQNGDLVCQRLLSAETGVSRCDLTQLVQGEKFAQFMIYIDASDRFSRVKLAVQLEAGCF